MVTSCAFKLYGPLRHDAAVPFFHFYGGKMRKDVLGGVGLRCFPVIASEAKQSIGPQRQNGLLRR